MMKVPCVRVCGLFPTLKSCVVWGFSEHHIFICKEAIIMIAKISLMRIWDFSDCMNSFSVHTPELSLQPTPQLERYSRSPQREKLLIQTWLNNEAPSF